MPSKSRPVHKTICEKLLRASSKRGLKGLEEGGGVGTPFDQKTMVHRADDLFLVFPYAVMPRRTTSWMEAWPQRLWGSKRRGLVPFSV